MSDFASPEFAKRFHLEALDFDEFRARLPKIQPGTKIVSYRYWYADLNRWWAIAYFLDDESAEHVDCRGFETKEQMMQALDVIASSSPGCKIKVRSRDKWNDELVERARRSSGKIHNMTPHILEKKQQDEEKPKTYYATIQHDPISHYHWLDLQSRIPDDLIQELYPLGWRWSRRMQQYRTNIKYWRVPKWLEVEDLGEVDNSSDRADRYQTIAEHASERGQGHYKAAHEIGSHIPLGQPILVGHHSERRHRRDLARIEGHMDKWIEESDKAKYYEQKAEGSEAHRAHVQNPRTIARSLDRDRAALRKLHREKAQWLPGLADTWQRRVDTLTADIERKEAQLEAAGGLLADKLDVEKGDIISIGGFVGRVTTKPRQGGKTYSITITEGGAKGSTLNLDRTRLKAIVKKSAEVEPGSIEAPARPKKGQYVRLKIYGLARVEKVNRISLDIVTVDPQGEPHKISSVHQANLRTGLDMVLEIYDTLPPPPIESE